jgi:phage tail protein X
MRPRSFAVLTAAKVLGPALLTLLLCSQQCRAQDEGPLPALQRQQAQSNSQGAEADPANAPANASHGGVQELDNEAIIRMTRAQVGDSLIMQMVRTQPGDLRTGPDDLIALKNAGVSQAVISAMLARNSGLAQRPDPKPVEVTPLSPDVDDPGLYYKNKQGQWEAVSPELVKYRDGGALKSLVTNNIVKKDMNGEVTGPKSSLQIEPGTEMLILAPRLSDAVEYIILRFRTKSDRREFRVKTGNVFHSETGADRDQVDIPIHKVASRIFSFRVPPDITKGEYGVLPPGNASTPGIAYAGKMYTFRVAD